MKLHRRDCLNLAAMLTIAPVPLLAQAQISAAVAINRAARLRALSQRSVKLLCQKQLNVLPKQANDTLGIAQRLIQLSIDDLSKAQLNAEAAAQYRLVSQEANSLNRLFAGAPSKEMLIAANGQADKLLNAADTLTRQIEQATKQESAALINLAGRQRMLSQRMAKNYFLAAAGLDAPAQRQQMIGDRSDFSKALQSLGSAAVNTAAIKAELELARAQWLFFEQQIQRPADEAGLQTVATTSERILEVMNNLTTQYEIALRDTLGRV
jgi:hypothetical protein